MTSSFCCSIIKSAGETAKKVLLSIILKSNAYRNKVSLKLGYRAVNARKYVRCAHTFYFLYIFQAPRDPEREIRLRNVFVLNFGVRIKQLPALKLIHALYIKVTD